MNSTPTSGPPSTPQTRTQAAEHRSPHSGTQAPSSRESRFPQHDRLCVTRLDRLGRSLRELLETVDDLEARSIHLVSLAERLDTCSAAGELVFHVFGAIAHFERRLISSPSAPATASRLDPETVSAAQKLTEGGLSPARAAKQLGIGRATAYRIAAASRDGPLSPLP